MDLTNIYGLVDPRDGAVRYVGKSNDPEKRVRQHVRQALRDGPTNKKKKWLAELHDLGLEPDVLIFATPPMDEWGEREKQVVAELREAGAELYNVAEPGCGFDGLDIWGHNPERRRWLRKRNCEMWRDPEFRELYAEKSREYWADAERRRRWSELLKALWENNDEAKAKIAALRAENWADPDYRRRVTESNVKKWSDPDLLEEHAERTRQLWEDPEYREKVVERMMDPEVQARRRESMAETWDEEKRAEHSEKMREMWADPEFRDKRAEAMEGAGPKISQSLKDHYADPENRERLSRQARERMADPERRENLSEKVAALWDDPGYREQQLRTRNQGKLRPDVEKAAEALGVKPCTVYKYCHQGKLGHKVGGSWVITDEEIEVFACARSRTVV